MNAIARRVAQARQAIVQAALTAGRDPGEVTLVAATKTQTDDAIRQVIAAGVTVCGENRVQELTAHLEDHAAALEARRDEILSANGEDMAAARAAGIAAHSETLGEKQTAMKCREGLTTAVTNTIILLTALTVLGTTLVLCRNGAVGGEAVLICTLSALGSFGPVVALANLAANLVQVFASADRVLDLLEETPITPEVINGGNTAFTGAAADHVTFAYGQETILNDLSLTVPKGQIVGITGKSGSGKSTLLRLFMRFWDAGSGKITFGGADIRSVNTAALRSQESFVTQDTELFADTIENNVRIANRNATHEQVVEACQKASLHDFITSLPQGYGTQVGELGGALSGGERQRIGVARAFLHDAPFVLMDEPTSNLDSLNEGVILKAVKEECRDKTVLLVSHRASTMAVANTVYSVESGRVS